MAGFRESLGNAYRGAVCSSLDLRNQIAGLTLRRAPAALALVNAINGVQGLYCDRESNTTEDDIAPRPFTGGQCPGRSYNIQIDWSVQRSDGANPTGTSSPSNRIGPISGVSMARSEASPTRAIQARFTDATGPVVGGNAYVTPFGTTIDSFSFSNVRVTPSDGLPDECGSPPRELPPPSPGWNLPPVNFTYENDLGVTVNATANISIAPAINIDGSVSFPTNVSVGAINLSGTLNLNGTLNLSPTLNINPAPEAPSVGPELPGGDDPPPAENGDVLAGVIVRVTTIGPRVTEQVAIGAPNLLIPRAASVNFLQPIEGQDHWSSDYDVKNAECFVPVPPGPESIDAAVTPYPGVVLSWRRVYQSERIPPGD